MAAKDEHLEQLICHCPTWPVGHPLDTSGCEAKVTAGNYPSRSRNAPSHPRPSTMAAEIYAVLAKTADTPEQRLQFKTSADIAKAATREHSAQESRTPERAREIRSRSLPSKRAA